jgi:hypothetical protein
VQKKPVRRAEPGSSSLAEPQPLEVEFAQDLPGVPVLLETILRLDLEVQEPCPDLRVLSQLVLSDLGATLQILRLAAEQHGDAPDRPTRIEDCIAALGAAACIEAVSAQTVLHDSRYSAIAETWMHAREIAHYSRMVAEEMPDMNPDEAYLVGLLHAVGLLPAALGWSGSERKTFDAARAGLQMARQWSLPKGVVDYFRGLAQDDSETSWPGIVHRAHKLANRSSILCPLERDVRPLLYRAV